MNRIAPCLRALAAAAVLLLLCACAPRVDPTPVWQTVLPGSGAGLTIANCAVEETTTPGDGQASLPLLRCDGVALLTITGAGAEQVDLRFALPDNDGVRFYNDNLPAEKIDYVLTAGEDGSLQYRLDTAYSFALTVTTAEGSDTLIIDCRREL